MQIILQFAYHNKYKNVSQKMIYRLHFVKRFLHSLLNQQLTNAKEQMFIDYLKRTDPINNGLPENKEKY